MKLLFEQSTCGRGCDILGSCDVPLVQHKGMERIKNCTCLRWRKMISAGIIQNWLRIRME